MAGLQEWHCSRQHIRVVRLTFLLPPPALSSRPSRPFCAGSARPRVGESLIAARLPFLVKLERVRVAARRNKSRYLPYAETSVPVSLDKGAEAQPLPLFGSAAGAAAAEPQSAPAAKRQKLSTGSDAGQSKTSTAGRVRDAVFHVGGPVWAMDWCPAGGNGAADVRTPLAHESQYLAVRHASSPGAPAETHRQTASTW